MTREEAIAVLEAIRQFTMKHYPWSTEDEEAIDMAISALQEPSDYIEGDIDFHCDLKHNRMTWFNNIAESANDAVEKNDEVIERPIIDHDREWIIGCIKYDGFIKTDRFDKANQIILDALATKDSCTEPSDLISRAELLRELLNTTMYLGNATDFNYMIPITSVENIIANAPSVSAERVGEWSAEDVNGLYHCSLCNYGVLYNNYRYCPNCGARMENTK